MEKYFPTQSDFDQFHAALMDAFLAGIRYGQTHTPPATDEEIREFAEAFESIAPYTPIYPPEEYERIYQHRLHQMEEFLRTTPDPYDKSRVPILQHTYEMERQAAEARWNRYMAGNKQK